MNWYIHMWDITFGGLLGFIIGQIFVIWENLKDQAKEEELGELEEELQGWRIHVDDLMEGRISFEAAQAAYLEGKNDQR